MVDALIDTSVVIDIFRAYPSALSWLNTQTNTLGVTRFVWHEVIEGCGNKPQQRVAIKILKKFELIPITNDDVEWATTALLDFYLKGNVEPFDCFIASTAHRLQIPLYTGNLKHFTPLLGKLAVKPY